LKEESGRVESGGIEQRLIEASAAIRRLESIQELGSGIQIRRVRKGVQGGAGLLGYTGIFRGISADLAPEKSFRVGSYLGFYSVGDLWDDTRHSHLDTIGFFTYTFDPQWEVRVAGIARAHSTGPIARYDDRIFSQTLGDLYTGIKYAHPALPYLSLGGTFDLHFYTRVNSFLLEESATSFAAYLFGTTNFYDPVWDKIGFPRLPMRFHLTTGFELDHSARVMNRVAIPNASTFGGFGLRPGNIWVLIASLEWIEEPFGYFLEYSAEPILYRTSSIMEDRPTWNRSPQRFTLGVRWNPYENLLLVLASDIAFGLTKPIRMYGQKEPVLPPYTLHFGVSYEWNPKGWEVIDIRGQVVGIVVDARTGLPVGGAIIGYLNRDLNPQITDPETGSFATYKIPPGEVALMIQKEGYEPVILRPEIQARERLDQKIFLQPKGYGVGSLKGVVVARVEDPSGTPVTATLTFLGRPELPPLTYDPRANEEGVEIYLDPGTYPVKVDAPGYEPQQYELPVVQGQKTTALLRIYPLQVLGILEGIVTDPDKKPLGARITFLSGEALPIVAEADGSFSRALPPGSYSIMISAEGYESRSYTVPIEAGKKTRLEVVLLPRSEIGAFSGVVLSEEGQPLQATLLFLDSTLPPLLTDPATGEFFTTLKEGKYVVAIRSEGYEEKRYEIPILAGKKTVMEFRLSPEKLLEEGLATVVGDRILTAKPIRFEPGTDLLTEDSYPILQAVARLFLRTKKILRIEGHTHSLGPREVNLKLSERRAKAVAKYLERQGVPPSRMKPVGKGEDFPIATNATPEGRAKNERIEFHLE
jgi:outer membrane protein OmpA-like peptidoglycan-associated protein